MDFLELGELRHGRVILPPLIGTRPACCARGNNLYGYGGQVQIYGIGDTYIQSTYIQITYIVS